VTIAIANNGDMKRMQRLAVEFERENADLELAWVVLEENLLRQRVTLDVALQSGQYDVVMVGNYEVPIWADRGWLVPLDGDDFASDDLIPAIAQALSRDGRLYGAPFYAESALTMYRKDLFEGAGIDMPPSPSWSLVVDAARRLTDTEKGVYGICLRGKAGWGENMALVSTMAHSWGARWFDMEWRPQLVTRAWQEAVDTYVTLLRDYGPPGSSTNGFNENLALFQSGRCAMWMDASVAASFVTDPAQSSVHDRVGFALFPSNEGVRNHGNWLWAWSFVVPTAARDTAAAKRFVEWATGPRYMRRVIEESGWASAPPGTRISLYESPEYRRAAPFWDVVLSAIASANTAKPAVEDVPYVGGNFVSIAPYQSIGTLVGQQMSAAVAGSLSAAEALHRAQAITEREMRRARFTQSSGDHDR
jgi:sorbitol/mannitol transport system substrate-binding protein